MTTRAGLGWPTRFDPKGELCFEVLECERVCMDKGETLQADVLLWLDYKCEKDFTREGIAESAA